MNDLIKLKMNLLSLIRLGKTELSDSIEDLKRNMDKIKYYKLLNSSKYNERIKKHEDFNKILLEIIINNNNQLLKYYDELNKLNSVKTPGENFTYNLNESHLEKINNNQFNLEYSISKLDESLKLEERCKKSVNDDRIIIISSQTDYYIKEILSNYEKLKLSKIEYYKERYPEILVKKYN